LRGVHGALQIPRARYDKGKGVAQVGLVAGWEETAGPSTTLRSGRDDNFVEADKDATCGFFPGRGYRCPLQVNALPLQSRCGKRTRTYREPPQAP
jgi:hypothetical protein